MGAELIAGVGIAVAPEPELLQPDTTQRMAAAARTGRIAAELVVDTAGTWHLRQIAKCAGSGNG